MSDQNKRVQIAIDVIKQLNTKTIKASPGNYFSFDINVNSDNSLRHNINNNQCDVCAKGAIFVSIVRLYKDLHNRGEGGYNKIFKNVISRHSEDFFTKAQLSEIEHAFEGWITPTGINYYPARLLTPEKRMRMIMQNIIDNDGEFKGDDYLVEVNKENA